MADTTLCPNCNFNNPPGMRFCGNCGTRISDAPPLVIPPPSASESASVVASQNLGAQNLGAMIGSDLLERFRKAGLEASGQRRNVTVLFADISGFTSLSTRTDSEDLYEVIQRFTQVMAQNVYKYEGMVDKFTGDGLMALFGAPIMHENNAELAVRAALDMQTDIERLNQEVVKEIGAPLRVRIGLNAGSVTVGGIGSNMLMNYTAIGDTVNLSQRLQDATQPGTIMVSQSVYNATRMLFNFESMPGLRLKGFSDPVTGYRLMNEKEKPGSVRGLEGLRAPMIGREAEYQQLQQAMSQVQHTRLGHFALIIGEGGLGKSRLTAELKTSCEADVNILEGHSLTYRRNVPYWIFQDMLRSAIGATSAMSPFEARKRLLDHLKTIANEEERQRSGLQPYLENLLGLPPSDSSQAMRIDLLDASQLRQQIFLAVRAWLQAVARRRPTLVVLEDLHWADDTSLELIQFLLPSAQHFPLFFLGVTRPYQEGPLQAMTEWARQNLKQQLTLLQLQTLSPAQSQQLLLQLVRIENLPDSLRQRIIEQSSGIPFYLEEMLRMLMDQGILQRHGDSWQMRANLESGELGIPSSLQGLILARFDRAQPEQRRVMQAAAVIGRQFSLPVLQLVLYDVRPTDLDSVLKGLVEREFVVPEMEGAIPAYAFRHVIVSDAIYSTLLKRDRADLHGRVGKAIENTYKDQLENQIEILARHFAWSSFKDRALHYLIMAGERASRSYSAAQARKYFEEALELLLQIPHSTLQAIQVNMGLAQVLLLTGEYDGARQRFERALELFDRQEYPVSPDQISSLYRNIATTYERQGDYDSALMYLTKADQMLVNMAVPAPVEQSLVLNDMGWIRFRQGQRDLAQTLLLEAMELSEQTPRYDVTASIYNRLGGVYWQKGDLDHASEFVQKSITLRIEMGDTAALARSYNNLGLLHWMTGKWDSALENFDRCLELNASLGDIEGSITAHGNLGLLQLDRGETEAAHCHFEEALAQSQQIGHTYNIANSYLNFGQLYIMSGEWQKAYDYATLSLKMYTELEAREDVALLYTILGAAAVELNDLELAQKWADEAAAQLGWDDAKRPPQPSDAGGRLQRLRGEIQRATHAYDQAEHWLQLSLQTFTQMGNQLEQGRAIIYLAKLALLDGQYERAHELAAQARQTFEKLGARRDLMQLEQLT